GRLLCLHTSPTNAAPSRDVRPRRLVIQPAITIKGKVSGRGMESAAILFRRSLASNAQRTSEPPATNIWPLTAPYFAKDAAKESSRIAGKSSITEQASRKPLVLVAE